MKSLEVRSKIGRQACEAGGGLTSGKHESVNYAGNGARKYRVGRCVRSHLTDLDSIKTSVPVVPTQRVGEKPRKTSKPKEVSDLQRGHRTQKGQTTAPQPIVQLLIEKGAKSKESSRPQQG